ncbi:Tetratricopeptide repeat protein [Planctomycetes bacterium Poly30]|uniref:Tetratricopeptide repeat protein n=1 Tax=Saltatorellus ferox TaxID=2528018 RepID=A0A518EY99_9BACT|nr:Tetratricopeptide repeat protein [Planctomycetes bacterium Poly30]
MLHSSQRLRAFPPVAPSRLFGLALLGLAAPQALSAPLPSAWTSPLETATASALRDVGPPPRVGDMSAMDPALVALLDERIAAVEKEPTSVEARVALGFAYESNTIWSLAEECYSQALELAPDENQWRFRRGVVRHALGEIDGALNDLRAAATAYKNTPVVQARLGDVLRLIGELDEAEAAWRQAIAAEANQPQPIEYAASRVGLAQTLIDLGEPAEAEALCRRALELQPDYKQAHFTLGVALSDQGRDEEARPELVMGETSFQQFPPDPHGTQLREATRGFSRRMMLIENQVQAGDLAGAKQGLDEVLKERPNDHMVLNLASRVLLSSGDMEGARELLQKSLDVSPNEPGTLIDACLLALRESEAIVGQLGQMQMAQQQGQPLDEARFEELRRQGTVKATEAVEYAAKAVQAAPTVGRNHYWLGVAQRSLAGFATDAQAQGQQFQAALQSMQNALRLGCTEPGFNQQLAQLYAQMGRPREMMLHTERHLSEFPMNPIALQMMIENSIRSGMPELATAEALTPYVERLLAVTPGDAGAAQFAVRVYLTVKDLDRAESALSVFEKAAAGVPQAAEFITAVQAAIAAERAAPTDPDGETTDDQTSDQGA